MDKLLNYLKEYIDEAAVCVDWNEEAKKRLSLQLSGAFDFTYAGLLGEHVLFLNPMESYTVGQMEKWCGVIEAKSGMQTAIVMDEATPYTIKKLLGDRIGFVVPGKQMSLPFLAMQIKNQKSHIAKDIKSFSPSTQMIYLYILYSKDDDFSLEAVSYALGISSMTATRGMRDLSDLGLLSYDIMGQTGRKKVFTRLPQKEYYMTGRKYLAPPVRDILYVSRLPEGMQVLKSDLTALGEQTMLSEPEQKCYCIPSKERDLLKECVITKEQAKEEHLPMVQLIKYDVRRLSRDGYEDPISLILGLSERDERIDMAISELMEGKAWYEE